MSINLKELNIQIVNLPEVKRAAREAAKDILEKQKGELINEFNNHPVTKEIESGPNASNQSRTLGGVGNLFSFIGFDNTDTPTAPVKKLIDRIRLSTATARVVSENIIKYKVEIPSEDEFESVTKMPWESGRSWLFDVEKSISGLGQYLYGKFQKSRSGSGLQLSRTVTKANFRPVGYFGTMLKKFKRKLNGG